MTVLTLHVNCVLTSIFVLFFLQICVQHCIDVVAVVEMNSIQQSSIRENVPTYSIDLIHENNAWLVISRVAKHLANQTSALPDVFVNDRTRHNLQTNVHGIN